MRGKRASCWRFITAVPTTMAASKLTEPCHGRKSRRRIEIVAAPTKIKSAIARAGVNLRMRAAVAIRIALFIQPGFTRARTMRVARMRFGFIMAPKRSQFVVWTRASTAVAAKLAININIL